MLVIGTVPTSLDEVVAGEVSFEAQRLKVGSLKGLFGFFLGGFLGFILFHYVFAAGTLKTFPWFINGAGVFLKKWKAMHIQTTPSPVLRVPGDPITWSPKVIYHLLLAFIGGIMVGFFSVLAGGCPFRQHVMAAEGSRSALSYILGFAIGAVIFS